MLQTPSPDLLLLRRRSSSGLSLLGEVEAEVKRHPPAAAIDSSEGKTEEKKEDAPTDLPEGPSNDPPAPAAMSESAPPPPTSSGPQDPKTPLVGENVCGPLSIPDRGGFSYFITFTDDHSRYGYVYLMRYKSEAFGRFKEYRLEVENQTSRKIKALRSDRGGEYLSGKFIDYLKENGILSQWTPPGTHNSTEWLKGGTKPYWTWFGQ
ncbi:UNVERIFIED_CONTAM: hypothetical protein Slati_2264700 [Sesamum latifolium]|uniref:Integrase catalytic domain-containing protein n=1 Tax=Sesamum latifolium TaxID=2727402 RepID=A0AAW2WUZ1_9LAMI